VILLGYDFINISAILLFRQKVSLEHEESFDCVGGRGSIRRRYIMKMRNLVKEKLASNGYVLGAFVASGSATNAEILGLNNMDFILIDMEHAQTNMETMVDMVRASELYGMAPFVRVYDPADGPMMARMLDVGVHGLMIPMVETPEQARYIIDNVKILRLANAAWAQGADLTGAGMKTTIRASAMTTSTPSCSARQEKVLLI
jgi:2-keto-3-deoxy-L-rhamnonate aldolase RhmA